MTTDVKYTRLQVYEKEVDHGSLLSWLVVKQRCTNVSLQTTRHVVIITNVRETRRDEQTGSAFTDRSARRRLRTNVV